MLFDLVSDAGSAAANAGHARNRAAGESEGLRAATNPSAEDRSGESGSRFGTSADGSTNPMTVPARSASADLATNLGGRTAPGTTGSQRSLDAGHDSTGLSAATSRSMTNAAQGLTDQRQDMPESGLHAPFGPTQPVDRSAGDRGASERSTNVDISAIGVRPLLPERPALTTARAEAEPSAATVPPAVQIGVVEVRIMPPALPPITLPTSQTATAGRGAPATAPTRLSRPVATYGLAQG